MTTVAPSRTSVRAIASPMPREPPVTSATLPSSGGHQASWSTTATSRPTVVPGGEAGERLRHLGERHRRHIRFHGPGCGELGEGGVRLPRHLGHAVEVEAPVQADDAEVLDERDAGLDVLDLAAREADEDEPAFEGDGLLRGAVGVAADRVEDDVDPATAGGLQRDRHQVFGAAVDDDLGAQPARQLAFLGVADDGDHPRARGGGQLHRGGSDSPGCGGHQHGLARFQFGTAVQARPTPSGSPR